MYKLMISYLPMIIIIIGVGLFSYRISMNILMEESIKIVNQAGEQANDGVKKSIIGYEDFIKNIFYSSTMQDFLKNSSINDAYSLYKNIDNFNKILSTWLSTFNYPVNLAIIRSDDKAQEIINNNCHYILQYREENNVLANSGNGNYQIFNSYRVKDRKWFKNLKMDFKDFTWMQIDDDRKYNNISLIKAIPDFVTFDRPAGYIILTVRLKDIFTNIIANDNSNEYYSMVFDKKGDFIYTNSEKQEAYNNNKIELQKFLKSSETKKIVDGYTVVTKSRIEATGWQILNFIPMAGIKKQTQYIGTMVLLSCGIAIIIVLIISYWLSRIFSKRITKICRYMQDFQGGDFNKRLETVYNDELGYLAHSYNEMVEKTEVLVKEVYVANIDKKEAKLKALQAQINPHFLYNSLSSIIRLANKGEVNKINTMVSSLVKFYRMTLNKGKDIIPVGEEIEQIKAYVEVLKIRMKDAFEIYYNIDDEVLKYNTINVILQPFIENVLDHGIYDREGPINIVFSAAATETAVTFQICDDGIGISREIQKNIFAGEGNSKGYGIRNVDDRIKLHYGNDFGVTIFSRLCLGTTVVIKIPIVL